VSNHQFNFKEKSSFRFDYFEPKFGYI